jgi:succinate dehydrogenase cytochrome b subunit
MYWIGQFIGSSVGKKLLMALTGFCFIGFLSVHLTGNLTLYAGKEMFNSYAEHLHGLGPLLTVAEWGLLSLALVHIITGTLLFFQNLRARPQRYIMNKRAGGRTYSSATMPYTGLIILAFVIFHLLNFHFIDKSTTTIYEIVDNAFESIPYVMLYVAAMIILALHIRHGFWSLFQTLGANHPKYMPLIMGASIVLSIIFGFGFGYLPIYLTISG